MVAETSPDASDDGVDGVDGVSGEFGREEGRSCSGVGCATGLFIYDTDEPRPWPSAGIWLRVIVEKTDSPIFKRIR